MNLFYNRSDRAISIHPVLLTLFLIVAMSPLYAQVPTITNMSPLSGPVGTSVTITGTNFSTTAANNTVFFGAVKATVTAASATSLTVTVPSGSTEQPVSVSVGGLVVVSHFIFNVTFAGGTLEMGTPVNLTAGSLPRTAVIADIDGDGKPDLLTINNSSNTISVFRSVSGTGTITGTSFAGKIDLATEAAPVGLAVGDLDGDGKPDVAAVSISMSTISVFKNTSTSGTVSFAARIDFPTAASPRGIALGDLNSDGKPELVAVGNNNVYIYKNLSTTGTIDNSSFPTYLGFAVNNSPEFVLVDDVDNDGRLDLVVSSNSTMGTTVLRNTFTTGNFSFAVKVSVAAGTGVNGNIVLTDLDGDGKRDMVQSAPGSSLFYVSRNISTKNFLVEFEPYFTVTTSIQYLSCVAAGDCDGDGKPDLVLGSNANEVLIFKNQASFGFLDRSSLSALPVEFTLGTPGTDINSVAVGDLNADSKPDVLASYNSGSKLLVLENGATPSTPTVPQTITFDPITSPKPYGTVFNLVATATSGLTVSFTSSDPSVIAVSGTSATVVGIGTATITATQNGDLVYMPATPVAIPVTTIKADQVISWGAAFSPKTVGDPDFTFTSTTTSNLPLTFTSSNTAVATISGKILHIVGAGTSTITVSQAGNAFYNAAPSLTQDLIVAKADQTITFAAIPQKFVDDADFTLGATASSGLTVSYSSSNTAVATVTGNLVNIVGAGTTTITASQAGNVNYNAASPKQQVLTVVKKDQTITFAAISQKFVDDADFTLGATSSSGLAVSYSSSNTAVATVTGNLVHIVGAGSTTITASQAGDVVYNAASPKQQVLTVVKKDQTITFAALPQKFVDDADFTLGATASSGLTVSYISSNASVATVTGNLVHIVGIGSTTITASQAGSVVYNAATSKQQVLTVVKKEQTITFEAIADKTIGDADFTLSATASSGLPVSYSSSNALVATISGNTVHIVGIGTSTITASQNGNTIFNAATPVAHPLIVEAVTGTVNEVSNGVSFYPNPTTDHVTIIADRFNQHSNIDVALVDMYGRVVVQQSLRANSDKRVDLSISSLDDGIYVIHVMQGNLKLRNRLVKIQ